MLSDARVKDVQRDFEHGSDTLRRIEPRLFRYRQGWGDHQRGDPEAAPAYAGIVAQELPDELAPFCRFASRFHAPPAAASSASYPDPDADPDADSDADPDADPDADSARYPPRATTLSPATTPSPTTPSRAVALPRLSDMAAASDAWPADGQADHPAGYHPSDDHRANDARRGARLQEAQSLRAAGGRRGHNQLGARGADEAAMPAGAAAASAVAEASDAAASEAAEAAGLGSGADADAGAGSSAWLYQTPMLHEVGPRPALPPPPARPALPLPKSTRRPVATVAHSVFAERPLPPHPHPLPPARSTWARCRLCSSTPPTDSACRYATCSGRLTRCRACKPARPPPLQPALLPRLQPGRPSGAGGCLPCTTLRPPPRHPGRPRRRRRPRRDARESRRGPLISGL